MRQRVKLAQAMAHDPQIVVLDEPLNGLDPLARAEAIALFEQWGKNVEPAFVELTAPHAAPLEECAIDFECPSGRKMRIQWKASAPPDWVSLLRAWREMEG